MKLIDMRQKELGYGQSSVWVGQTQEVCIFGQFVDNNWNSIKVSGFG